MRERSNNNLHGVEPQFGNSLDSLIEGVLILDHNWRYLYVNSTLASQGKSTKEQLLGFTLMEKFPGIEQTAIYRAAQRCMSQRQTQHFETAFEFPDKSINWFELHMEPVEQGIFINSIDITERKAAEEKLNRVKNLYAFISQINKNILRVNEEKTLFHDTCQFALEFGKFKMAWIGLFDFTNNKINLIDHAGIANEDLKLFANVPYQANGPQDSVLRTESHYTCSDIQNDQELANWKPFATKHGIQSCLVLPIKKADKIIGTFNLYASVINYFGSEEIDLVLEVAKDISLGLDIFDQVKKQKETEQLLAESEKRFRALIEKGSDMILLRSPEGKLHYVSPSIPNKLGYTNEEILNINAFQIIHPDDVPNMMEQMKIILKTPGSSFFRQVRLLCKNGGWIWSEGTVTNMLNEPGISALVSNFRDITEKKLHQQQLEFDQNNLKALINNTTDLMWSVDLNFNLITCNEQFNDMAFYLSGNRIKQGESVLSKGFPEEQLKQYKKYYEKAFTGETFSHIEYINIDREIWTQISFYPIRVGNHIVGTACHGRDITDQKKADKELRKNFDQLKEAQEIAHLGSWELNFSSGVALWSAEACRIYGLAPTDNEHSYEKWLSFIHPDDLNEVLATIAEQNKTLSNAILNHRIVLPDGGVKHIHTQSRFQFDEHGKPIGINGIAHDVTASKKLEHELSLQNQALLKTNSELDRFVYSVSHDLRSPLTSVLGLLAFIEVDSKEPETLEHVAMIRVSIKRLDEFITNILHYSRNNRTELNVGLVPLQQTIAETIESLNHIKGADDIEFKLQIDEKEPFYSDTLRVSIVLENLIANAIKYHDPDKKNCFVKITAKSSKTDLKLQLEDNGIGILPDYHGKIFDMFFRLPSKTDGSGIGLYIVKEVIEKLHGNIQVSSDSGRGTTFTISLKNMQP